MAYAFINNVPDDWNTYYYSCGCHASSGCDCNSDDPENSERPWLANTDYTFTYEDGTWAKLISTTFHTCRKDHKDGTIRKGDRYKKSVWRYIEDKSGESWHLTSKVNYRAHL
jgi:hypothetical protein